MLKYLNFIIIILVSSTAFSQDLPDRTFGDWTVSSIGETGAVALTTNKDDTLAGVLCFEECYAIISVGLSCEEGDTYPFLISFDEGASGEMLECVLLADNYYLTLSDEHLDQMVTSAEMGVAYGLKSGKFQATYFSLSGSTKAVLEARKRADASPNRAAVNRKGSVPLQ